MRVGPNTTERVSPQQQYLNMMKKILYGAHSNVAMGLGIFEYDEEDFVRRALQCRNGLGLAGGGLRHEVVGGVL